MINNINIFVSINAIGALTPEMGAHILLLTTSTVVKFSYSNHTCKYRRHNGINLNHKVNSCYSRVCSTKITLQCPDCVFNQTIRANQCVSRIYNNVPCSVVDETEKSKDQNEDIIAKVQVQFSFCFYCCGCS